MNDSLIKEVESYVSGLFDQYCNETFVFHNFQHTLQVVSRALEIARNYQLEKIQEEELIIAAWFHDAGYLFVDPKIHEEKSIEIMAQWMTDRSVDSRIISTIADCILSTKFDRNPQNLLEEILCDADTYHLGTEEFLLSDKKVYEEFHFRNPNLTEQQFAKTALKMLDIHRFHTSYCKILLNEKKEQNIQHLKEQFGL